MRRILGILTIAALVFAYSCQKETLPNTEAAVALSEPCSTKTVPLAYFPQGMYYEFGKVTISNDDNNVYVKFVLDAGNSVADQGMNNVFLWLGDDATKVPVNAAYCQIQEEQMPYQVKLPGGTTEYTFTIPFSTLSANLGKTINCKTQLYMALRVDALLFSGTFQLFASETNYDCYFYYGVVSYQPGCCTPPPSGCTYTWGYWKTHGPAATGNNSNEWPAAIKANGLKLGNVTYTAAQLQSIFDRSVAGNGLVSLAHQLIAAKINVANGASSSAVSQAIIDADKLIGDNVIPPVGSATMRTSATSSLVSALTSYNEGLTGPGHCD